MEQKTKVQAVEGTQTILVTRDFELPVELLFRAYAEPELVEQWMGTKVLKLENKQHGGYRFETTDPKGNVHAFHGVIHEFSQNERIVRTFEMENTPFAAQLEFLEYERLTDETSRLTMQIVYRTAALRDQMLQMPFAQGINMAHQRLQTIAGSTL